jgi:hypothetical protein
VNSFGGEFFQFIPCCPQLASQGIEVSRLDDARSGSDLSATGTHSTPTRSIPFNYLQKEKEHLWCSFSFWWSRGESENICFANIFTARPKGLTPFA